MRFVMFITRAKQTWLFGFKSNKYIFVFYVEEELEHVLKHALWSFDKDARSHVLCLEVSMLHSWIEFMLG